MANRRHIEDTDGFGLTAFGASGPWEVAIDEVLDREGKWTAETEGPNFYICFDVRELDVAKEALDYLTGPSSVGNARRQHSSSRGDALDCDIRRRAGQGERRDV